MNLLVALVIVLAVVVAALIVAALVVVLRGRRAAESRAEGQAEYCAVEAPEPEIDIERHEGPR